MSHTTRPCSFIACPTSLVRLMAWHLSIKIICMSCTARGIDLPACALLLLLERVWTTPPMSANASIILSEYLYQMKVISPSTLLPDNHNYHVLWLIVSPPLGFITIAFFSVDSTTFQSICTNTGWKPILFHILLFFNFSYIKPHLLLTKLRYHNISLFKYSNCCPSIASQHNLT